ncbi:hypothetical protein CDV36_011071 [Fusarium kuroshium]|uniref:Plastocyanin-like domain-containing protein n=1 Tax=Fusarium kuroshium TaxID=2010991 RepID=A0A3M2RVJ9_9HYPO|nr:hypothetical protein CDV36_011071 [Fusarium kuroshium]
MTRSYELETGVRWMNPDKMAVGGGSSGFGHPKTGPWNDGTAGLSQFPTLPRSNWTTTYDTTGNWGLNWYIDHTSSASVDGLYGLVYVAPSPSRPRPYHLITNDTLELHQIKEAERAIQHAAIQNHQHRDTVWKLLRMKAEGSEYYCYDSILVNGKGRVHCRQPGFEQLNGKALDGKGCIQPASLPDEDCSATDADYEVFETGGQRYIMMNLMNNGFEHSVKVSIDSHKMIVVANNGGFVVPEQTDVVYIPSAARITVLVKLDAEPGDYAMRISSTSQLQNLQGYSILRYPAKRLPRYGEPMMLPTPASPKDVCLLADASTKSHCKTIDGQFIAPYPPKPPPTSDQKYPERADFTFRLSAGSQPSLTEPKVPEFYLNEKPWQLFHGSMTPLLFHRLDPNESLDKPIISQLPVGSVVDLIIENQINDTIPLYKHGNPAWLLGSSSRQSFPGESVEDAVSSPGSPHTSLNLHNPALVTVHDLPPLGWSVLRFEVTSQAASMLHSAKLRYFLLGMTVPILEGITAENPIEIPKEALDRPHVEFEPKNDGIFG